MNIKKNKENLLQRLEKYPRLRLRKRQHLYIIDSKELEGHNIGGYGTIAELHDNLTLMENKPRFAATYWRSKR